MNNDEALMLQIMENFSQQFPLDESRQEYALWYTPDRTPAEPSFPLAYCDTLADIEHFLSLLAFTTRYVWVKIMHTDNNNDTWICTLPYSQLSPSLYGFEQYTQGTHSPSFKRFGISKYAEYW